MSMDTNTLGTALGIIMAQNPMGKVDQPIAYSHRSLTITKWNYSTIEREALAMICVVKKSQHYLLGNQLNYVVNNHALIHLVNPLVVSDHIARPIMLLMEYNIGFIFIYGNNYIMVDFHSRAPTINDNQYKLDNFPNSYIEQTSFSIRDKSIN